ncbi:2-dehydro-3-deoxygalactonokinase [Xylophilus sp.]|uniref:2-dehydro-3-deoxygalactonokinase n=1 Tax=Xylophilus sp. TaxID=2653893 RepID=UPI0013B897C5|nr:2-dehydro-3-deoxygalactonokinase [Xylophilus sp.]KAF1048347.1 MAG: putative 2-dehydro-3-deoxygalactonokinase DgoK1 [Xylophilus sp.]
MTATLIALDWGTSSLRAYRMGAAGRVLESRRLSWGIMHLPPAPGGTADADPAQGFDRAFEAACGDWLRDEPGLPVIACGMVGSAQGWREAAYLDLPTRLDGLAAQLVRVPRGDAAPLHIVPGLIARGTLPNVMRGEETQVAGVLAGLPPARAGGDVLIGLPGTHSKWVDVRAGEVRHFDTFMTGEVYAVLRGHTILGRTMQEAGPPDEAAFARGLDVAGSQAGRLGVLSTIFSCRTLGLTGELGARAQADYLSGLLVGHEVAALAASLAGGGRTPNIVLCGETALCDRYALALERNGLGRPARVHGATERGLWQLAVASGLAAA